MSKTTREIVQNFSDGATSGRASSVSISDNFLYSWGMVIAVRLPGRKRFMINGDKVSDSTTFSQGIARELLKPGGVIGASAFPFPVMDRLASGKAVLVEHTEDETARSEKPGDWPSNEPGWTVSRYGKDGWSAHRPGSSLIRFRGICYLCGMDEGSYFVCQLPRRAASIRTAYSQLEPAEVRKAREAGKIVLRQGEWFFTAEPFIETTNLKAPTIKQGALENMGIMPRGVKYANVHVCREMRISHGAIYARGTVSHKREHTLDKGKLVSTGQHRRLNLGKIWHRVARNMAVRSWSANGGVD